MRFVFIGDVHGCRDELFDLLDKLSPRSDDRIVFLGDLIDRGPDPVGVVRFVRKIGAVCILGNHEEKALRWHRHEAKRAADPKYKNPMKAPKPEREAQWRGLDAEDIAFLSACPPYFEAGGWVAVHGGFVPGLALDKQRVPEMIRCRWVNAAGKHVGMERGSLDMPKGARPWMEAFDGRFNVVCGHAVHSMTEPRVDRSVSGHEVWSIDTGCVFGGRLSALIVDSESTEVRDVVQVPSRREYAPLRGDGIE